MHTPERSGNIRFVTDRPTAAAPVRPEWIYGAEGAPAHSVRTELYPETAAVRAAYADDPFITPAEYGSLVETALIADVRRLERAEVDPDLRPDGSTAWPHWALADEGWSPAV